MNSESEFEGNESSANTNRALFMGNNKLKHTNPLNLLPKFLKSESPFFNNNMVVRMKEQDRLRKNTSHHHIGMLNMRNVKHLPDDFMHVKKFTNLDTVPHDNQALSKESVGSEYDSDFLELQDSQMDISDAGQKFQKHNKKWRSTIVDPKQK
jgi:hypothetical protein